MKPQYSVIGNMAKKKGCPNGAFKINGKCYKFAREGGDLHEFTRFVGEKLGDHSLDESIIDQWFFSWGLPPTAYIIYQVRNK